MITYALNEMGEFVHVDDARRGQSYICPCCKVPLTPRRCTSCRSHFRITKEKHKSSRCKQLESSRNIERDIHYLDANKFFAHLSRKVVPPGGDAGDDRPKSNPSHEEKTLAPANLSQLLGLAAELRNPDMKLLNGQPLHNILIRYQDIGKFYVKNHPFNNRVLELCPDSAANGRILLTANIGSKQKTYFSLYVPDEELYSTLVSEIFSTVKGACTGYIWENARIRRVFVMAKWSWALDSTLRMHDVVCDSVKARYYMQEATLNRRQDVQWVDFSEEKP